VKQKLCRRLEYLEKISAAAAVQARASSVDRSVLDELIAKAQAWHADPVNQKWLAEQPPEFFPNSPWLNPVFLLDDIETAAGRDGATLGSDAGR
jgi:hypothetical protein